MRVLRDAACFYCASQTNVGLDRIDSARHCYCYANVVPACSACNYAKHTLSTHEFIRLVQDIAIFQATKVSRVTHRHRNTLPTYARFVRDCKRRQLHNCLNEAAWNTLMRHPCIYCGTPCAMGIDRTDSGWHYDLTNVQPCCCRCNMMKHRQLHAEFLGRIERTIKTFFFL
jgi:hypothetical protein